MNGQRGCIIGSLWEGKTKTVKKTNSFITYLLLHFSSNLLKLSQFNLYTITKKTYFGHRKFEYFLKDFFFNFIITILYLKIIKMQSKIFFSFNIRNNSRKFEKIA